MIKNIVFDISNVLAPFRYKEFLAEKGFDAAMTPYWTEYEKGKLTYEEAIEVFLSVDPDIREELHKAYDECSGIMGRYDYTENWIDGAVMSKAGENA